MQTKHKLPIALGLAIILIICVKVVLPKPFKNRELQKEFWVSKTHVDKRFATVIGGDSRVYRGFSTEVFKEQTGVSAYNFAYSSAGWSKEYLNFLWSKLDTSSSKATLILGLSPHSFTGRGAKNEQFNTFASLSDFEVFRGTKLSKYKPEELVKGALGIPDETMYFEDFRSGGWVHSHKLPEDSTSAIPTYQKTFKGNHVSPQIEAQFVSTVGAFIQDKSIRVIAYRSPTTNQMADLEDSMSGFDETQLKGQLEAVGVECIDFDNNRFRSYDGSHLHYEAALQLTEELAEFYLKKEH
jgi:hypothetical protein